MTNAMQQQNEFIQKIDRIKFIEKKGRKKKFNQVSAIWIQSCILVHCTGQFNLDICLVDWCKCLWTQLQRCQLTGKYFMLFNLMLFPSSFIFSPSRCTFNCYVSFVYIERTHHLWTFVQLIFSFIFCDCQFSKCNFIVRVNLLVLMPIDFRYS